MRSSKSFIRYQVEVTPQNFRKYLVFGSRLILVVFFSFILQLLLLLTVPYMFRLNLWRSNRQMDRRLQTDNRQTADAQRFATQAECESNALFEAKKTDTRGQGERDIDQTGTATLGTNYWKAGRSE